MLLFVFTGTLSAEMRIELKQMDFSCRKLPNNKFYYSPDELWRQILFITPRAPLDSFELVLAKEEPRDL